MRLRDIVFGCCLLGSAASFAGPVTFGLKNPYGTVLGNSLTALDWAESGTGVVINQPSILKVGDVLDFRFQMKLVGMTPQENTTIPGAVGLITPFSSGGYEFTVVSNLQFVVTGVNGNIYSYDTIDNSGTAFIYYDDATKANNRAVTATGTGFDDGLLVAQLSVHGHDGESGAGHATYQQTSDNPQDGGVGTSKIRFDISNPGDFINSSVFYSPAGLIDFMIFDSTQNRPTGTSQTGMVYNHMVDSTDVLLKVDGSSQMWKTTVPEPTTLSLLFLGLLGMVGYFRRLI